MSTTLPRLQTEPPAIGAAMDVSIRRHVVVVTGTRAEYGLLRTVMRAVREHPNLMLHVAAAGSHLLPRSDGAPTVEEVRAEFAVEAIVPMQEPGRSGRLQDAKALGRGVEGFAAVFERLKPDWVVVLGDRIEAFAAASAASVGGIAVAHIHGGDRAEGVADEAMRHAITKLAHLHLPAAEESGYRIIRMGEDERHVFVVGSPAIDEIASFRPMPDGDADPLGDPDTLLLMHPIGRTDAEEFQDAAAVIDGLRRDVTRRILALEPNHDPGREGVMKALGQSGVRVVSHLERRDFIGLLRRVAVLVGNSSAGLIEAAAVGCPVVNIGPRQSGRYAPPNVINVPEARVEAVDLAVRQASRLRGAPPSHPFGPGESGVRIARTLARIDPHAPSLLRKRNSY